MSTEAEVIMRAWTLEAYNIDRGKWYEDKRYLPSFKVGRQVDRENRNLTPSTYTVQAHYTRARQHLTGNEFRHGGKVNKNAHLRMLTGRRSMQWVSEGSAPLMYK